jgi:hypothetical protein
VHRKYSTSLPLDRSDNTFPMDQVESLSSRASAVSGYMSSWREGGGRRHWLQQQQQQQREGSGRNEEQRGRRAVDVTGKKRSRQTAAETETETETAAEALSSLASSAVVVDLCSSGDELPAFPPPPARPPMARSLSSASSTSAGGGGGSGFIPIRRPKSLDIK